MGYIGKHGVEALHRYKYSGVDRSYVAKYILQPFWRRFVNYFPLWMPPNGITLMGFLFVVASSLLSYGVSVVTGLSCLGSLAVSQCICDNHEAPEDTKSGSAEILRPSSHGNLTLRTGLVQIYSPTLDIPSPKWVVFAQGMLLFLYQTFDAVDGKQARRTNSSSPLGELFDHGCDALTCAFETMAFGSTVLSGRNSIWFWAIATIPFYGATWESFFAGTLILPELNGPTEGLLLIYGVHFFTSIVGTTWWTLNFRDAVPLLRFLTFVPDMPLNIIIIWFMLIFAVTPTFGYNVYNVSKVVKGRGGSMIPALAMLLPFVGLLGGITTWASLSPSDILATQPHLLLVGSGFAFGYMVGRLILAHLCEEHKGLKTGMCTALLFLPLAIANALSARLLGGEPLVNELVLLLGFVAFQSLLYLHFATGVVFEITTALGIYCFRVGKVKDRKGA